MPPGTLKTQQHGSLQNPEDGPEALTEVSSLVSTRPSWLQTVTHSSPILGLRVEFPAPSSEQDMGGWLEGRIPGTVLKYRQVPGVLSVVTLAVMRISSPAEDPARGTGEQMGKNKQGADCHLQTSVCS